MNKKIACLALLVCTLHLYLLPTQLIQGDVSPTTASSGCPAPATKSFNDAIDSAVYDVANGIFYVGLKETILSSGQEYALSSFKRSVGSKGNLRFQARATDSILKNKNIAYLAMATGNGDTSSRVAGVAKTLLGGGEDKVFIADLKNRVEQSSALLQYNSMLNDNGSTAEEIVAVEANRNFIFAAVTANGEDFFGEGDSGIALVSIDQCNLTLEQTAAVPGDMGIKAQQLNNTSPFIRIGGSDDRPPTIDGNTANLYWDDYLERLYIGVTVKSEIDMLAGEGLRSVVLAQTDICQGTLPLFDFAPAAAFNTDEDNIVGVTLGIDGESLYLTCSHLQVMHCSTGPSYLIINGGNGRALSQIFALPLVDLCDPTQNDQGKLANKNSFNSSTHHYEQAAAAHADLTTSADIFAQVGAGPLPILPSQEVFAMQVVGDAVYVSLKIPQDDSNETGLLYSQAQFDSAGKIKSWSPWTKRAWPICGFPNSPSQSQVSFFAVDAVTGKIIAVDSTYETVRITQWDEGDLCNPCATDCSLVANINRSLCEGSYSVLDLDQSTTGIGQSIAYRYALFGGTDKVDIALISQSRAASAPFDIDPMTNIPYPQRVTTDFCCPDFFKETTLPSPGGCVNTLEYARRREAQGNTNYFFAGTNQGFFAFAQPGGQGFNVTDLGTLNTGLFCQGSWQHVDTVPGAIMDIATSGNTLYVLTFTTSCETPFESKVLRIDYADDLATMFDPSNIVTIATSSNMPTLENTLLFTAIEIIQTDADGTQEQLVLTTNNGLFQTKKPGGVQTAASQTDAQWHAILQDTLYYGIGAIDNARIMSTVWPFSAQDACGCKTYELSSIHQLNARCVDASDFTLVPTCFNQYVSTCPSRECSSIDCPCECVTPCQEATTVCSTSCDPDCCVNPSFSHTICAPSCCDPCAPFEKIVYFWSDGGRRFFIINPVNAKLACLPCCEKQSCCCNPFNQLRYLQVTPFNPCLWNVPDPVQWVLQDCVLRTVSAFYWVRHIGMSGVLLAGTQSGVVALE